MVVIASPFLDTSLFASQIAGSTPLVDAERSRIPSPVAPSATLRNTEEQHSQRKKAPSSSSWISFFLAGASQKPPIMPLLEDMSVSQVGSTAFNSVPISHEPVKLSTKKVPRGAKHVTFTPQKARELREKLKGTDSFHDFMYHSAIASRLASHDS